MGNPRTASWAEFLGDLGYARPDFLIGQIDWWMRAIKARASSLVIGDFAPTALLAARIMGIPAVAVGTGYSVPPSGMARFPTLIPDYATRIYDEMALLTSLNAAVTRFGLAPLASFSELYANSAQLARTIPALDPYRACRTQDLLPPLNEAPVAYAGAGDEVFVYFSTSERDDAPLMHALGKLGLPTRLYMPAIPSHLAADLASKGVAIETAPLPIAEIARRSRLLVHAGQHGTLCMALGLGLPQVAFPRHLEHLYHALKAEALGSLRVVRGEVRDADAMIEAIRGAYGDSTMACAARGLAQRLRPHLWGDFKAMVQNRLMPLLAP